MFKAGTTVTYIDTVTGVTQDGERYTAINVMTKGTHKKKLSFLTTKPELMDKINQMKFIDFQDVYISVVFTREVNKNRFTYWNAELIDVGTNRANN